ncbi:MAG: cation:dicarboxylase symporter family transporter [Sphingomonas bacterium]|uniref:dicarboxylate/amino acid:cation symporter n=1 Tax=Sphingomonas bacterium TaxID=1895847 RepID=UPI002631A511|nr:cation:dicarboxylase symporter family transporter [Sphingomonas bacterium]MDB5704870.1 cation:dicarboxylase symporter family transporter [Sphingomonas bacterium]
MSQATRILSALALGLALGIGLAAWNVSIADIAIALGIRRFSAWNTSTADIGVLFLQPIGTAWLNALQMTVVPLVVALLVTGVAATAEAARAGRIAGRALGLFIVLLWFFSIMAGVLTPLLLGWFPLPAEAATALRAALSTTQPVGDIPPFSDFIASIVPTNPIAAAANNAFLPLIVFTMVFAFALTRLPAEPRQLLTNFFQAIADVMLVVIGWILWLAPLGVFALAYVVSARAGTAALGALLHYVMIVSSIGIIVWIASFPIGAIGGRVGLPRFIRATVPAQAVAISTQSSLASLPAMLRGAEGLGVPVATSGVILPLAVAIFRVTGPPMNLAVAIYVAYWFGIPLGPTQLAAGIAVAAITTLGAVSLPGQISYVTSIAPICIAMGVPIAPLGLLVAVETIPDIFRTLGNVTMDLATTVSVSARSGAVVETEADLLLRDATP